MAAQWFELASQKDVPIAHYHLALMYFDGTGVEQNFQKSTDLFAKAAVGGIVDAQYFLALAYRGGYGVPASKTMSHVWMNIASANGDSDARVVFI